MDSSFIHYCRRERTKLDLRHFFNARQTIECDGVASHWKGTFKLSS